MKNNQKLAFLITLMLFCNIAMVYSQVPDGWNITGRGYDITLDRNVVYSGKNSVHFSPSVSDSIPFMYANLFQRIQAKQYCGKRIRISAYIKSSDLKGEVLLDVSVNLKNSDSTVYENGNRIKGSKDWTNDNIVIDIPTTASIIRFGIIISSANTFSKNGEVWVDNFKIEEVDKNVQLTKRAINETPINLNFDE